MDQAAGKSTSLHVLLSSTPTSETWKRSLELISRGDDVTWRGSSNESLLHLVASAARTSSHVHFLPQYPTCQELMTLKKCFFVFILGYGRRLFLTVYFSVQHFQVLHFPAPLFGPPNSSLAFCSPAFSAPQLLYWV